MYLYSYIPMNLSTSSTQLNALPMPKLSTKTPEQHEIKYLLVSLYLSTFTVTERLAFIAFLEYLLVAYCRWGEQHGGRGCEGPIP